MNVRTAALAARLGLAAVAGLVLQVFVQTVVPASATASASSGLSAAVDDRSATVATKRGDGTLVRSIARGGPDRLAAFDSPDLLVATAFPRWEFDPATDAIATNVAAPVAVHVRPQPRAPPVA